jgi:hypothetical protein
VDDVPPEPLVPDEPVELVPPEPGDAVPAPPPVVSSPPQATSKHEASTQADVDFMGKDLLGKTTTKSPIGDQTSLAANDQ